MKALDQVWVEGLEALPAILCPLGVQVDPTSVEVEIVGCEAS